MKKLILTLIVVFATVCGFAQDGDLVNPGFYEIKGKVKNVPDGTVLPRRRVRWRLARSR